MENTDDQFSLKWNNFQTNLATGFHDLLQEEMMVDVTLAAEGKILHAHKIILSVCSPYFKDLFKVNPCQHPIVILKDVGHQEMADMLDFMYRGEANVRQEDLAAFLKLAETLKVKGLAGDRAEDEDVPPPSSQAPRKLSSPQVPKKKKVIETPVFESDDHDPGDPDFNSGGGDLRRKKRRGTSPPKTDSVMPSPSSSSAQPFPLANPKQEMPDPEEIQLIDENEETNDPLVQLISGQGPKQEQDQHDFDDSNFDNTLEDPGDGSQEPDFDMNAGPSNPDESTDQVPQDIINYLKTKYNRSYVVYCPKCSQHYSSPAHLKRHLKYECGVEAQFSCPHCCYRAKRKDNLHAHMARKHLHNRQKNSATAHSKKLTCIRGYLKPFKPFRCSQCHRQYSEKSTLTRHLNWECGKSPRFKCIWCPHQTKFKFSLTKHMKRHHLPLVVENDYSVNNNSNISQ